MAPNKKTPGPSRGARGPRIAQLGGIEHQQDTTSAAGCQGVLPRPQRLALRPIYNRTGHFLGLEVVHV